MGKRTFTAEYKTQVVLEVLREERQLGEIAAEHGISPNQLRNWKREFLENASRVFNESKREKDIRAKEKELEAERAELLSTIGQLTMERDWLKKNPLKCMDLTTRKSLAKNFSELTLSRRCELLEIPRTSMYNKPVERDSERESTIKNRLDYWHTKMPYLGVRKLRDRLQNEDGMKVGRKLIKRYMDEMGIYAVYPKPNLSKHDALVPVSLQDEKKRKRYICGSKRYHTRGTPKGTPRRDAAFINEQIKLRRVRIKEIEMEVGSEQ